MIAIPGNTPASTISAIIADEAAIGMINNKTTAVRVIPVPARTSATMLNSAASSAIARSSMSINTSQMNSLPAAAASRRPCAV